MAERRDASKPPAADRPSIIRAVVVQTLLDPDLRERAGLPRAEDAPVPILIEINEKHAHGRSGAAGRLTDLWAATGAPPLRTVTNGYYVAALSVAGIRELVWHDHESGDRTRQAIARVWPDMPVRPLSVGTYRTAAAAASALAARRSYSALGEGITWAILDSGVDGAHPHFRLHKTLRGAAAPFHRDFSRDAANGCADAALTDRLGHGTHNAGIIAGGLPARLSRGLRITVAQGVHDPLATSGRHYEPVSAEPDQLAGVAPHCQIVSCLVLDEDGQGRSSDVMAALSYIREEVNDGGRRLLVHGVNVGLGYPYDPREYACGQTPLCNEIDRLVRSGVVVVTAAGNTGSGKVEAFSGVEQTGLMVTINDPGNAALAITVGSTDRDSPHTFGVSWFSSKGPTADGRLKPDLVAPGERIMSCAAGQWLESVYGKKRARPANEAPYVDQSGTSAACAYVSGAVAAFLSVHREFIGRPEDVKRIFLETATSLGREAYFQGRGMVNLLQALQAV